jgi:hypothetical protein
MSEIMFKNPFNQIAWNKYKESKVNEGANNTSLLQYKEAAMQLEKSCNGLEFSTITVKQLHNARENKPQKISHINGFIVDCVNMDLFDIFNDVKIEVIPLNYRNFVAKMFKVKK